MSKKRKIGKGSDKFEPNLYPYNLYQKVKHDISKDDLKKLRNEIKDYDKKINSTTDELIKVSKKRSSINRNFNMEVLNEELKMLESSKRIKELEYQSKLKGLSEGWIISSPPKRRKSPRKSSSKKK